jgi:Ca2+-binding RTX toxin-like protein
MERGRGVTILWRQSRLGLVALLMVLAWAPLPAGAVTTCTHFSGGSNPLLQVNMTEPGDAAVLGRAGDALQVNGGGCGSATVNNTNYFYVLDLTDPPADTTMTVSLEGGPLAPGFTNETGSSDEMEFTFNLDYEGRSDGDKLRIRGSAGGERIRFGLPVPANRRVNLNASESDGIDHELQDIFPATVEHWILVALGGNDVISGVGGAGTGGTFDAPLELWGGDGRDKLTGGSAGDELLGGPQNDVLAGGPGPDVLNGGPGRDTCTGGAGADTIIGCES